MSNDQTGSAEHPEGSNGRIRAISLTGDPGERGAQYGRAASAQIQLSLEAYERAFSYYAKWNWEKVRSEASRYWDAITAHGAQYVEELEGVASGAGVDDVDVLAINCRTEIMFAAKARDATGETTLPPLECSSLAVLPNRAKGGRLLAGQTWDWLAHARETLVTLVVDRDDGPNYVTVVEAGLLAKFGMNSSGISVCTNALVSAEDQGDPGVPYHVMLRSLLDAESLQAAVGSIVRSVRASSANYLLSSADGIALDVEAAPGDYSRVFLVYPTDDVVIHTNHFLASTGDLKDASVWDMPDSPIRLVRLQALMDGRSDAVDVGFLQKLLSDHAEYPHGVCCHPDDSLPEVERYGTATAVVMDPGERQMWLTSGPPCENRFEAAVPEGALDSSVT